MCFVVPLVLKSTYYSMTTLPGLVFWKDRLWDTPPPAHSWEPGSLSPFSTPGSSSTMCWRWTLLPAQLWLGCGRKPAINRLKAMLIGFDFKEDLLIIRKRKEKQSWKAVSPVLSADSPPEEISPGACMSPTRTSILGSEIGSQLLRTCSSRSCPARTLLTKKSLF